MSTRTLLDQLRTKAEWHAREAERYRTALEVVQAEAGSAGGADSVGAPLDTPNASPDMPASTARRARAPRSATMGLLETTVNAEGRDWTVPALVSAMDAAGWDTPVENKVNTVRTAISRLAERGVVERVRPGVYRRYDRGDSARDNAVDLVVAAVTSDLPTLNGSGSSAPEGALI